MDNHVKEVLSHRPKLRQVFDTRMTSFVFRFNRQPLVHRQSVAEHSFHVAILAMILWDNLLDKSVVDRQTLIEKCILHDVGEVFSGDIHYQLKKFAPEICDVEDRFVRSRVTDGHCLYKYLGLLTDDNSLKTNEYVMMKFCDMLELLLYCCEERVAGSNYLEDVLHRAYNICEGFLSEHSWLNCNWIRDLLGEIKDEFLVGSNL